MLAVVLLACSSPDPTPVPAPSVDAPAPDPKPTVDAPQVDAAGREWVAGEWKTDDPGHAGLNAMLGGNGACHDAGMEKPERAVVWKLPDGAELIAAVCETFAYQSNHDWFVQDAEGMRPLVWADEGGRITGMLGTVSVAPSAGSSSAIHTSGLRSDCTVPVRDQPSSTSRMNGPVAPPGS